MKASNAAAVRKEDQIASTQDQSLRAKVQARVRAWRTISILVCRLFPAVLLVAYTAPSITYQLPNYRSNLAEEYQPLQTLKFFSTRGAAFHKYGPMENFLLAPLYGSTILYWKATGQMDGDR